MYVYTVIVTVYVPNTLSGGMVGVGPGFLNGHGDRNVIL